MLRTGERLLLAAAVVCLLGVAANFTLDTSLACSDAYDDRASGFIDHPPGDREWSWPRFGVECRYTFDESPHITVTVRPPLYRLPAAVLSVGVILYLRQTRRARRAASARSASSEPMP